MSLLTGSGSFAVVEQGTRALDVLQDAKEYSVLLQNCVVCGGKTHDRVWVRRSTRLRHYCVCVVWGEIYFSCDLYSHVSSYSHSLVSLNKRSLKPYASL